MLLLVVAEHHAYPTRAWGWGCSTLLLCLYLLTRTLPAWLCVLLLLLLLQVIEDVDKDRQWSVTHAMFSLFDKPPDTPLLLRAAAAAAGD
jgi:hypothetical protein